MTSDRAKENVVSEQEIRWEYDVVEVGQEGPPIVFDVTEELIAKYATAVRNDNPAYQPLGARETGSRELLAMPTMITRAAPLRRGDIAANNGFVAQERAKENPFQTPFAKCEIRWFAPVRAGDTLTSSGHIVEKYERRGNKFVTIRVEADNQRGERVAEYDYTCIFEFGKGQKKAEGE